MAVNAEHGGGRTPWRTAVWGTLAALMLLPVVAMAVTDAMAWSAFDFAFLGTLLLGAGVAYEFAARKAANAAYLSGVGVAVAAAFLLVVVTGAVGIIGTENDDANVMYGGVLAVGIIGAVIARFEPGGMVRALLATALVQALVAAIALVGGWGSSANPEWPWDILGVTALFVALWLASACLFRKAAQQIRATAAP